MTLAVELALRTVVHIINKILKNIYKKIIQYLNNKYITHAFFFFFLTVIEAFKTGPKLQQQVRLEWKTEKRELLFMSHVLNDLMMLLRQAEYLTFPTSLSAACFCFGSPPESK